MREGRLDLAEYERRLVVVQAARVRKDLTPALADLPVHSGQTGQGLRISTAEREGALVRLTDALTDGRIEAAAYADAEERLHRAVTYADVDAVVGKLDARASVAERDQAIARVEAAAAAGQLDETERDARVAAARSATTDAQLAALVADLSSDTRAPGARASNAEREAVAARMQEAVEAGLLDIAEFDERVRAVYAARLRDELTRLVADLPAPAPPPAPLPVPPPAPAPARSVKSVAVNTFVVALVGTLATVGVVTALGMAGFTVLAVLLLVAWMIFMVVFAIRARRTIYGGSSVGRGGKLAGHKRYIQSLTCLVLPDGTPLAISGAQDNTAMVWDLAARAPRHTLTGHTHDVSGVAATFLPDGSPVAVTASGDGSVRVWDLRDGAQRATLPGVARDTRAVSCLTLPDGVPIAVTANLDAVQVWDLWDVKLRRTVEADFFIDGLAPIVLPDGTPIVAMIGTHDHAVVLLNLKNGKRRRRLYGHTDMLTAIAATVLPDGTPVAVSAALDKTIRVWDLAQGTLLRTIAGMLSEKRSVVCTSLPDGTPVVIASGSENTQVWDLRSGAELRTLDVWGSPIAGVAAPGRTLLLSTTGDGSDLAVHPLQ